MAMPTSIRSNVGITVGDLRTALEGIPDDALVTIYDTRILSVHPRVDRIMLTTHGITD